MASSRVNFTFTFNSIWWCCWFCNCQKFTNVVLITLLSNTFSVWFSCSVKDQISPAYKTAGEVIVLHTFNLYVFGCQTEDKKFSPKWYQVYTEFCLHLISARVQFRFVGLLTAICALPPFLVLHCEPYRLLFYINTTYNLNLLFVELYIYIN